MLCGPFQYALAVECRWCAGYWLMQLVHLEAALLAEGRAVAERLRRSAPVAASWNTDAERRATFSAAK